MTEQPNHGSAVKDVLGITFVAHSALSFYILKHLVGKGVFAREDAEAILLEAAEDTLHAASSTGQAPKVAEAFAQHFAGLAALISAGATDANN